MYLDELVKSRQQQQSFNTDLSIVTATRGNHGQSIPYAARAYKVPVKVYVPRCNSREKNAAMKSWGAEVIEYGQDFEEARLKAIEVADELGAHLIPRKLLFSMVKLTTQYEN